MRHLATAFVLLAASLAPAAAVSSATASSSAPQAPILSSSGATATTKTVVARPKKKGKKKNKTKIKANWSATTIPSPAPVWVEGKVRDKGKIKRKVIVQQKRADGWKSVGSDKTNKKGEFAIGIPSDWYYGMKTRVITKKKKRSPGAKSKSERLNVVPNYVPQGSADSWTQIDPEYRLRWNPCKPIRYRINVAQAPAETEAAVHEAVGALGAATGLRFKFKGYTEAIFQGLPGTGKREKDADLIIAWARPEQTALSFVSAHAWGGSDKVVWGRDARGRMGKIVKGGTTFDVTTQGSWPYMKTVDTVMHELGHVVGLGHVNDETQIMAPGVNGPYIYGAGDLNGLNKIGLETGCVKPLRTRGGDLPSPEEAGLHFLEH